MCCAKMKLFPLICYNNFFQNAGRVLGRRELGRRGTQDPVFSLFCAASCTVPVRLVEFFGHGKVAKKKLFPSLRIFACVNAGSPGCHNTYVQVKTLYVVLSFTVWKL